MFYVYIPHCPPRVKVWVAGESRPALAARAPGTPSAGCTPTVPPAMEAATASAAASPADRRFSTEQEGGRPGVPGGPTDADAGGQPVIAADAAAGQPVTAAAAAGGQPVTASALPADVLDHIARQLGFRGWAALK